MEYFDKIKNIFSKKLNREMELKRDLSIINDLGVNSIDFVIILSEIEETFDIEIDLQDFDDYATITINELIQIIEDEKDGRIDI